MKGTPIVGKLYIYRPASVIVICLAPPTESLVGVFCAKVIHGGSLAKWDPKGKISYTYNPQVFEEITQEEADKVMGVAS